MYQLPTHLENTYGSNLGGIKRLLLAPRDWVDPGKDVIMDPLTGTVTQDVLLLPGYDWLSVRFVPETAIYRELQKATEAGDFFELIITGTVLKDEVPRLLTINAMRFHQFVVRVYDLNGAERIIGSSRTGMSFSSDYTTGRRVADASQFSIELVHQSPDPAPWYQGT